MKKLFLLVCILLIAMVPLAAQEEPGTGGPVIEGNSSGSINFSSLNPLRCWGTDCSVITNMLFPNLINIDPATTLYAPNTPDSLATGWDISDDGLVYTFYLREDAYWTDGEQITAEDVLFTANALYIDEIEASSWASFASVVESVEMIDDFTIQMNLYDAACTAFGDIAIPVIPSHLFEEPMDMVDHDFDFNPSPSYGIFQFLELNAGDRLSLAANQNAFWAENAVIPEGYLYVDVPDATVEMERFLAGEFNFTSGVATEHRDRIREADVQYFEYDGISWGYIGFNLGDPANPQNGVDDDGNVVPQDPHPIFGDVRVRHALQMALDVENIIDAALFGEGAVMPSFVVPWSWAFNQEIADNYPYGYDPAAAVALLAEAGWVDHDGDTETPLVCQGCLYADEGAEFTFELLTNDGNDARYRMGVMVQDQLREIGIDMAFTPMEFNTMIENTASQEYDAYLLGWSAGFPYDPDPSWFLSVEEDIIEWGFNDVSYYNEEFVDLMNEAKYLSGCDFDERAELYRQMQQIFMDDMPYIMIYIAQGMYAAQPDVENWSPYPNQSRWNVEQWTVRQD